MSRYGMYEDVHVIFQGFTEIENGRHAWTS